MCTVSVLLEADRYKPSMLNANEQMLTHLNKNTELMLILQQNKKLSKELWVGKCSTSWLLSETQRASVPPGWRRREWLFPERKWQMQKRWQKAAKKSEPYRWLWSNCLPSLRLWPVWFHWHQRPELLMGCHGQESCSLHAGKQMLTIVRDVPLQGKRNRSCLNT